MAKKFAPRVSKKNRKIVPLSDSLNPDLFKISDDKLLQGAKLAEIYLDDVKVKEQVRTKFNDKSIKELAQNIKENGLIQPLVLHKKGDVYTLICGERRFRAMSLIKMEKCPCFIIDNKTEEELMAIQFSENSSREELHYIDKADGILNYQKATKASERKIQKALGISKSEVHRSLILAKLSKKVKEAAKIYEIEKYVLLEWNQLDKGAFKNKVEKEILKGEITKRAQFKKVLKAGQIVKATKGKDVKKKPSIRGVTASAFLKAMDKKSKDFALDKETQELLKSIVKETRESI